MNDEKLYWHPNFDNFRTVNAFIKSNIVGDLQRDIVQLQCTVAETLDVSMPDLAAYLNDVGSHSWLRNTYFLALVPDKNACDKLQMKVLKARGDLTSVPMYVGYVCIDI